MSKKEIEILHRIIDRQKKARKEAEKILEHKSLELYNTSLKLKQVNKQLEILLDEKNSQLKGVFENINDAYLVMNIKGDIIKMNNVAEDFFGFNLKASRVNAKELIYEKDFSYALQSFSELLEKGKFSDYKSRIITKRNEIKWVNISASVIFDKDNKPIAAQGIIRDITEQVEKQKTIDLVNNTAKSILGIEDIVEISWNISSAIANYLNSEDCIIYLVDSASNSLEQIAAFGDKNDNNSIKNKIILPIGKGIVGTVAKTGKSEIIKDTSKDERYVLDDKIRLSEITVPIINNGEVIGVIDAEHENIDYFTKDHLDTIENIANIVSLQLKSAINSRERKKVEIKNKELLKKLTKSNEELKEYAHIVSHDLKSPLRSISALSSWIKMDNIECFDKNSLQNFADLELTLEQMEGLISNILEFSSLDNNKLNYSIIDLNNLVEELIKIMFVPENISIRILNTLPRIKGDKTKFQQLFQNLIGNAIKFNNKVQGIVSINVEDYNSFYKFSVKDNGIGVEERHFNKIFKIFQSLKKSEDSSGIGLSIVKKIVNLHHGEIWLESEINKGTTFYFTIKK